MVTLIPEHITIEIEIEGVVVPITGKFLSENSASLLQEQIDDKKNNFSFFEVDETITCNSVILDGELNDVIAVIKKSEGCDLTEMVTKAQKFSPFAILVIDNDVSAENVWTCVFSINSDLEIKVPIFGITFEDGEYFLSDTSKNNSPLLGKLMIDKTPQVLISVGKGLNIEQSGILSNLIQRVQHIMADTSDVDSLRKAFNSLDTADCSDDYCSTT